MSHSQKKGPQSAPYRVNPISCHKGSIAAPYDMKLLEEHIILRLKTTISTTHLLDNEAKDRLILVP